MSPCPRCTMSLGRDAALGKCNRCGLVFDPLFSAAPGDWRPVAIARVPTVPPDGFESRFEEIAPVSHSSEQLVPYREAAVERKTIPRPDATGFVRWKWSAVASRYNTSNGCLVVIGLIVTPWLAFLARESGMRVFVFFAVLIGILTAFTALSKVARRWNRTTITVDGAALRISHGPVPWFGKVVSATDIHQIWCTENQFKDGAYTHATYALDASLAGGRTLRLVRGLDRVEQALYLEQALELALGIVDVAVSRAGEVRPHPALEAEK